MKSSVTRVVLTGFGVVVALQVGAWLLIGRRALPKRVAALAEIDLLYFREYYVRDSRPIPHDFILEADYARSIGSDGLQSLSEMCKRLALSMYVEPKLPAGVDPESPPRCPHCIVFSHTVQLDTPLWAEVSTAYWHGPSGGVDFRHRLVFCLGVWIHVSNRVSGNA